MRKKTIIEAVQDEMKAITCDIRLEPLLVLALKNGLKPNDFVVSADSLFIREHSRDLISVELNEDAKKTEFLKFKISRSGIYDQLPEGFFFQQHEDRKGNNAVGDMAAEYKGNKKRESEIRRFFLPFESDFFWQRLQLEQEETKLLEGLQSGILNDYFMEFWGIPQSIPKQFIAPLILLFPYAHRIAGDLVLMVECLEQLLGEEVQGFQKRSFGNNISSDFSSRLGVNQLGFDMLCGEEFWEDCPLIRFEIGPLEGSVVTEYLEGGKRFELLDIFKRFFIPAGLDVEFEIKVLKTKENMIMEKGNEPILGYSSVL